MISEARSRISIGNAALLITSAMLVSRFLGLVRSSLLMALLGASAFSDAFNQATMFPELIFTIVAGGALTSAFISVFNGYCVGKRDEETAWQVANVVLSLTAVSMLALSVLGFLLADQLVYLYNPSVPLHGLIVALMRIMFLHVMVMCLGVMANAILHARQHFLLPAIGSVLYPLGAIAGLVPAFIMRNVYHQPDDSFAVYCAAWGVVAGTVLMAGGQIVGLKHVGLCYRFSAQWKHPGIWQMMRLMGPRALNTLVLHLTHTIDLFLITSFIGITGIFTQFKLAFTVIMIPLSLTMALGMAAFPSMTEYAAEGRIDRLRTMVIEALRSILFVAIPASVILIVLSLPIIQVLYQHDAFTINQSQMTSVPLMCYAIGMPGLAVVEILTRTFYALRQNGMVVIVSISHFVLKMVLGIFLLQPALWCAHRGWRIFPQSALTDGQLAGAWGMGALALATALAVLLEAGVLLWLLHRRIGGLHLRALVTFAGRVLQAALALGLALGVMNWTLGLVISHLVNESGYLTSFLGIALLLKLLGTVGVGGLVYLLMVRWLALLSDEATGPVQRMLVRLRLS